MDTVSHALWETAHDPHATLRGLVKNNICT